VRIARLASLWIAKGILLLAAPALFAADATTEPQVLTPGPTAFNALSRFASVLEALQKHYIQPPLINDAGHTTAALREYIRSLDPEADLLTAEEAAVAPSTTNTTGDVGLSVVVRYDYPTIVTPADGTAAQRAGLLAGDQLIAIDGRPMLHARLTEVTARLRGPVGSKLVARVRDPGTGETRDVPLKRASAPLPMEDPVVLRHGIVYFRVPEFSVAVVERLRPELLQPQVRQAPGLILDLRNNPGGAFEAAQAAASLFLPARAEIVTLDYPVPGLRSSFGSDTGSKFTAPVVVLVNGGTAAEAEIFAAALRDNKRARLVGSRTFGRGYHFDLVRLPDGSSLWLPTADYMPPSGQSFHNTGLSPDVVVELPRKTERGLATAGFGSFRSLGSKDRLLATDLPLARAVELLAK
jgi:carboxyl-terminal processing protease